MLGRMLILLMAMIPVAITIYFWNLGQVELPIEAIPDQRADTTESTIPDIYMTDTVTIHFNANGIPATRLVSDRLEGYRQRDKIYLSSPVIEGIEPDSKDWTAVADRGEMVHGSNAISMFGNVRFAESPASGAYNISTQSLTYQPSRRIAQSDERVTLRTDKHQLTAVGMIVDLEARQISLLSQVTGLHEPVN